MTMKTLGKAVIAASLFTAGGATAETYIFAEGLPPNHFHAVQTSGPLMKCITEGTGGAIDFNYMPGGQLLKMTDGTKGLKEGLADFAFISVGNEPSSLPLWQLTMLPGLSTTSVEGSAAMRKVLDDGGVLADELKAWNIMPITSNNLAPYQVLAKKRLDTPESWVGQKLRVSGAALAFLTEKIGGTAVQFPATDLFIAMQQGTVDGTVLSFASIKPYSAHEVATHYSRNMSLGTSSSFFGMRLDLFNSLPEDQQKVIVDCGLEIEKQAAQTIDEEEAQIAEELAGMGHEVYEVSPENLAAFAEKMVPVEEDLVRRISELGLPAQEALDQYKAAMGR